jgi:hypothetical protein
MLTASLSTWRAVIKARLVGRPGPFESTVCLLPLQKPLANSWRLLATPNLVHQAEFALDIKRKVLPLYEQVFDIEYPLPKLDTLVV